MFEDSPFPALEAELSKLKTDTELLKHYGRGDVAIPYEVLRQRQKRLLTRIESDAVIKPFAEVLCRELVSAVQVEQEKLNALLKRYGRHYDFIEKLRADFSVALKQTAAYQHLKYLLELMGLYLRFDRFDLYDKTVPMWNKLFEKQSTEPNHTLEQYKLAYISQKKQLENLEASNPVHSFTSLRLELNSCSPEQFDENNPTRSLLKLTELKWQLLKAQQESDITKFSGVTKLKVNARIERLSDAGLLPGQLITK